MNANRSKKEYIVSPYSLRVGSVVQWPAIGFTYARLDRFQGVIQSLERHWDGNVLITCSDVFNLNTGELCEADAVLDQVGFKLLSLSHVDKVVSMPENAPFLTADALRLKDILKSYVLARHEHVFEKMNKQFGIESWTANTSRATMMKAVDAIINAVWTSECLGYMLEPRMDLLIELLALEVQLKRRQPLHTLILSENVSSLMYPVLFTKAVRKQQDRLKTGVEYYAPVPLSFLPPLSILRRKVKQQFSRLLVSRAIVERDVRKADEEAWNRSMDGWFDDDDGVEDDCEQD